MSRTVPLPYVLFIVVAGGLITLLIGVATSDHQTHPLKTTSTYKTIEIPYEGSTITCITRTVAAGNASTDALSCDFTAFHRKKNR